MKQKLSIEDLQLSIDNFIKKTAHFPLSADFIKENNLPTLRTIERNFGGITEIRKLYQVHTDNRTGESRSKIVKEFNERGYIEENKLYKKLRALFKEQFIHRQYPISENSKHRADYCLFHKNGKIIVDVFYPKDQHSFVGCLNSKQRKYPRMNDQVIFVFSNDNIENYKQIVQNKKNKLFVNQSIMSQDEFIEFASTLTPYML